MAPDCSNIFSQLLDDHRRFVCLKTNLCPNVSKGPIIREIKDKEYRKINEIFSLLSYTNFACSFFLTHNTVKTFKKHHEHENQNFKMWVDRNNATKCVCVSSFIFSFHKRKTARNTNTTCLF